MVVVTQSNTYDEMAQNHTHTVLMPMSKYCYRPTLYNVLIGGSERRVQGSTATPYAPKKNAKFFKKSKEEVS